MFEALKEKNIKLIWRQITVLSFISINNISKIGKWTTKCLKNNNKMQTKNLYIGWGHFAVGTYSQDIIIGAQISRFSRHFIL